ncbi:MAG: hypothetical protein JJ843_00965 [Prochlorococcus marinus CUG1434]|nr:hypothetical protein [Prochlorococcus marinus CUG1434]
MSNRTNKYADKAKTPEMVIDGEKGIVPDSAEWHFYFHKRRFFDYLLDLDKDPNLENPLDKWDWDYLPEPSEEYDHNACAEYLVKQKKCQEMLKNAGYLGLQKAVYQLMADDYQRSLMHPESKGIYRSRLEGSLGWLNPETGEFSDNKAIKLKVKG